MERLQRVGVRLLLAMMAIAMYNDRHPPGLTFFTALPRPRAAAALKHS
jgi:hypothetical protein